MELALFVGIPTPDGRAMGEVVYLLVMGAAGGESPQLDRLKSQLAGMYEAVTAPYLEGE